MLTLASEIQKLVPAKELANVNSNVNGNPTTEPVQSHNKAATMSLSNVIEGTGDFWAKMDIKLQAMSVNITDSVTKAVSESVTKSVLSSIDERVAVLTASIPETVKAQVVIETEAFSQKFTEVEEEAARGTANVRLDLEKALVRIESLETNGAAALNRIEELEQHVSLLTGVALGVIDYARDLGDHMSDLEGRSRRANVRIYGVEEGLEKDSSVEKLVGTMVREHLGIQDFEVERAHRTSGIPSPPEQPPRSIVVKFTKEKDQEAILRKAWALKSFEHGGSRITFDRDNTNDVQVRKNSFRGIRKTLQSFEIRFKTQRLGQLTVFYTAPKAEEETYWSPYEAYQGLKSRGIEVEVVEAPLDLAEELTKKIWLVQGQEARTRAALKSFVSGKQLRRRRQGYSKKSP